MDPMTNEKDCLKSENCGMREISVDHGFMVRLHPDGIVTVSTPLDRHYPHIHPNCYAPADLSEVYLLKGGGSGTAVFHGRSAELGPIVMKHGGVKDSREVFSLVTIRQELIQRALQSPEAAEFMRTRIPEFVMVYVSPHHVRDRQTELWATLRAGALSSNLSHNAPLWTNRGSTESPRDRRKSLSQIKDVRRTRWLSIAASSDLDVNVSVKTVDLCIPGLHKGGRVEGGVETLIEMGRRLNKLQDLHKWKVTLGQKAIGSDTAENGAHVLTSGKLRADLLRVLINEFTSVIRCLEHLTSPEERGSIVNVRTALESLHRSRDVTELPKELDSFVGTAILKNYMPGTGRFDKLREFGKRFRSYGGDSPVESFGESISRLFLAEDETVPVAVLGSVLNRGASPIEVFVESPSSVFALDVVESRWLELLEHATAVEERSASDRIWTCGLTDAGLHNTFLSSERGLELFDLGEPRFVPKPAFLTKFLMSFFHTLGMEENGSGWVNRFKVEGSRIALTSETALKIPYVYDAYTATSNHFVTQLFDGDDHVRLLLVKYVVLQLLSDASFCLERWEVKGGGTERYGERVGTSLSQWLWRSLWDLYIASHVHATLLGSRSE